MLKLKLCDLSPETQPDGSISREKEYIAIALAQGSHRFQWLHRRITGEEFPAELLLTSIPLGSQAIIHSTLRDISEIKRAEEALAKF